MNWRKLSKHFSLCVLKASIPGRKQVHYLVYHNIQCI